MSRWPLIFLLALASLPTLAQDEDLFAEAGSSKERSRWVRIRHLPYIEISLRSDDTVLVKSFKHPANGLAMRLDQAGAVASECVLTENTQTHFRTSETTVVTGQHYWTECKFPDGTTSRAVAALSIVVQVSMTNKTTKPKELDSEQRKRLQTLDR